ncbi:MAG: tetratricopeptide repeat protein [Chloroflexi bacterium]|nr:tetratricopeptide repeat protein [Chloroflexota bacterium]
MRFCGNCGLRLLATGMLPALDHLPESEPAHRLGALIGADLLDRFRQAGLEAAGQRRQVTVLFVDLSGYTHLSQKIDSEELYDLVQQCSQTFANDVYKYDGMVDKFTGDGLMALFGAPIAHENNAELAIRAALDMQTDLAVLSASLKEKLGSEITAHIGLNSGSVIVGGIGSNMMMNYTAIGDVVNIASRIESAASSGDILVSDVVYRQVRSLFDFEALAPLQLKGVSQPVQTYRVKGTKTKPGSVRGIEGLYAPMIGRDGELERLHQTINAMISEKIGRFVSVHGEAGIGKSRLISEFKSFLSQLPVQVEEGYSLVYRKGVSYWIFQDALMRLLELDSETPKLECQIRLRAHVTRALPERVDDVLPYLEHLLSIPLSDPNAARRIEFLAADQLRQQIFLSVRDLLFADAQRKPVVLILEDLHWADDGSLELIDYLLDLLVKNQIVIVAVSRSFTDGKLADITRRASEQLRLRFTDLALRSLSPDQADRLLSQLTSIHNMPESLRNDIVQRASGIPLYLEEILRMLMDRQLLQREDGHWMLADSVDLKELGVPNTLEGLILTRFDHLEPVQRHVMKVASVIGRTFTRLLLVGCLPVLSDEEAGYSIEVLLEREFILPDPSPGGEYMFKHVLVSDTIYSTLLKRERKDLHGVVADTIEKLSVGHLENQIDVLARHYFWSDYKDRALHYLILAGQKAGRNHNTSQSQSYFEDALSLLPEVQHTALQAVQVHSGLGDALALAGDYPATRAAYELALQAIAGEQNINVEIVCELQRKIGVTYERQGDYDQALDCLDQATNILLQAGVDSPAELSQILNDTGWVNFRRGRLDEAESYLIQAQNLAEKTTRLDIVSSIYNRIGGVYFQKDRLKEASDFVGKSLALRQEIGDIPGVARSYNNLGLLGWKRGFWDEALLNFKRSAEYQAKLGDAEGIVELNSNLGMLEIDRGYMDEARKYLEEAWNRAQQIGHSYNIAVNTHYLSKFYVALGDWDNALDYCLRSERLQKDRGDGEYLVDVYVNLGIIYLAKNDLAKASQYAQTGLDLLKELAAEEQTEDKGRNLRLLGDIALVSMDYPRARDFYQQAEEIFTADGNRLERGRLLVSLSRLAKAQSNFKLAQSCRLLAQKLFEELGARLDLLKLQALKEEK